MEFMLNKILEGQEKMSETYATSKLEVNKHVDGIYDVLNSRIKALASQISSSHHKKNLRNLQDHGSV